MPHTLLLADDSVTIQRVIELTFADEDVQVIAVGDGDDAIAQIEARPPDIVLADVGMPGKNGYEVAAHIKRSPRLAHIPVVLLTGAFEPVDQAKAGAVGCDSVLTKPFEPQLVISRVKELLARPRQRLEATEPTQSKASPPAAAAGPETSGPAATPPRLDDYFDRLDAAFGDLSMGSATETPTKSASLTEELDWFALQAARAPSDSWEEIALPDLPPAQDELVSPHTSSRERSVSVPPAPSQPAEAPKREPAAEPKAAVVTPTPAARPTLAEAFAALLAAEQQVESQTPGRFPTKSWFLPTAAAPAITDDLIDQIARRVADHLSDRVVRETVREIVTSVAERLIRDEIEKIKASIK